MYKIENVSNQSQLEDCFYIRKEVFVKEQGTSIEDEFDEFDTLNHPECTHLIIYRENEPVATGRIRIVPPYGKLERIAIMQSSRKMGFGIRVVHALEAIAVSKGMTAFKLHGQEHARNFYEKLGYEVKSDIFLEEGIPHYLMTK